MRRPSEHRALHAVGNDIIGALVAGARSALAEARDAGQTDYLQVVQNWGAQAGARTNHLCLDLYDLPQIPHRIAEELGGAARFVIREGECPYCRLVRDESQPARAAALGGRRSVAFAPYASRSPFEIWVVPRRHDADFGRATPDDVAATAETLRQVLSRLAVSLDGPPYNLVLHTAPLRERVDATYHWHWEIHPRLREIAGLELGTGLPVNPVSPEDAVEELLGRAGRRQAAETVGLMGPSHEGQRRRHWADERTTPVEQPTIRPFGAFMSATHVPARLQPCRLRGRGGPRRERDLGPGRGRGIRRERCSRSTTARSTRTSCGWSATRSSPPT